MMNNNNFLHCPFDFDPEIYYTEQTKRGKKIGFQNI